jgi:hypothetical protein
MTACHRSFGNCYTHINPGDGLSGVGGGATLGAVNMRPMPWPRGSGRLHLDDGIAGPTLGGGIGYLTSEGFTSR